MGVSEVSSGSVGCCRDCWFCSNHSGSRDHGCCGAESSGCEVRRYHRAHAEDLFGLAHTRFDNADTLLTLFVNIGAMQTEVCVVRYTKHVAAGNVTVPHVHVLGCAHTAEVEREGPGEGGGGGLVAVAGRRAQDRPFDSRSNGGDIL